MECYLILVLFIMERMTIEKRVLVIKTFYENNESSTATVRKLRVKLGRDVAPNDQLEDWSTSLKRQVLY